MATNSKLNRIDDPHSQPAFSLQRSTSRASNKRDSAFNGLRTPWDESFAFTSEARRAIPAETLARIKELNALDVELHELGMQLLDAAIAEQRSKGTWQELPETPPEPPRPQKEKEEVAAKQKSDGDSNDSHDEL